MGGRVYETNITYLKISISRREARENTFERATIGFGFTSDWLRKWRGFFKPITKQSRARKTE